MVRAIGLCDWLVGFFIFEVDSRSYQLVWIKFVGLPNQLILAYLINSFWLVRQSEGLKWAGWDLSQLEKSTGFPELIVRAIDLRKIVGVSFNKKTILNDNELYNDFIFSTIVDSPK